MMLRPAAVPVALLCVVILALPAVASGESDIAPAVDSSLEVVEAKNPTALAVTLSQRRFEPTSARHALLARSDVFADALAGSALQAEGPLLFSRHDELDADVAHELTRVVPAGGTVYLLGGQAALSLAVQRHVESLGFATVRLAGQDRIETAAEVAEQIVRLYPDPQIALVARSDAWPDAIAAGAVAARDRVPLLLTPSTSLHPVAHAVIQALRPATPIVLGGQAALSKGVFASLPDAQRVAGSDRFGTAAAIADRFWSKGASAFTFAPGDIDLGWAWGLAVSGTAHDLSAPLLYTTSGNLPEPTLQTGGACTGGVTHRLVVGGPGTSSTISEQFATCEDPDPVGSAEVEIEAELFALANAERLARGLEPFVWDEDLTAVATEWSMSMAAAEELGHRPDLTAASQLAVLGENVYAGEGSYATSGSAHLGFMESPSHRNNLLQPGYALIGISVICDNGVMYTTQNFGSTDSADFDHDLQTPAQPLAFSGASGRRCP